MIRISLLTLLVLYCIITINDGLAVKFRTHRKYGIRTSSKLHVSSSQTTTKLNFLDENILKNFPLLSVYFVQGALGLSRLAISFYYKDELHLSPAETAAIAGITSIPWVIKPLYGFISDGLPLFGYRRRSYLILSGIMGCLSWLALGTIVTDSVGAVIANTIGSASIAVSDVVVDSVVVENSRNQLNITQEIQQDTTSNSNTLIATDSISDSSSSSTNNTDKVSSTTLVDTSMAGDLQSLCWGSAALGGITSAYYSGSLLQILSSRQVFVLTSLFPLIISVTSLFLNEEKITNTTQFKTSEFLTNIKNQFIQLKDTIINPSIYLPILFIFLWQSTPSPDSAMFYYTTNELHFEPEFLGRVRLAANIASLVGVVLFRTKLKDYSSKNIILWSTIISAILGMTPALLVTHYNRLLGIPDQLFSLTDTVVLTVLGQVAFMPTLVLASSLCPPGIEGTLFATLMSLFNAAGIVSSEIGAGLTSLLHVNETNYDNLVILIIICSLSSLLPLPFINLLEYSKPVKELKSS